MSDSKKPKSSWAERSQSIQHTRAVPFVYFEWKCEQLSELLEQWAFLDILGHIGRLTIIVAIFFYFYESESRQKAKHYQAWQVINSAQGKPGSGGRMDALQDLNRDGISLVGVDISGAFLPELNLENAKLERANISGADLYDSNLAGAKLLIANLSEAELERANLSGTDFYDANLVRADLSGADLSGAELIKSNLSEVRFYDANLSGAKILNANLTGAKLYYTNLVGANLSEAELAGAEFIGADLRKANLHDIKNWQAIQSIELANIYNVVNPPEGFIEWAKENGAVSIESKQEWIQILSQKRQEKAKEK